MMIINSFEIIPCNNEFKVNAKINNGQPMTFAVTASVKEAEAFIDECKAYNRGVYSSRVYDAINHAKHP